MVKSFESGTVQPGEAVASIADDWSSASSPAHGPYGFGVRFVVYQHQRDGGARIEKEYAARVSAPSPNTVHFRMMMACSGFLVGWGQLACLSRLGG
jgi:hypothetical protein